MTTPFTYAFGYSWWVVWGHLIPIVLFGGAALVAMRLRWRRWLVASFSLLALWGLAGLFITHFVFRLGFPMTLPTGQFLPHGGGRVVDIGAGSGRAAIGLLLARPGTTVTGVDIYEGFYGIEDNTPERFMLNARIAAVEHRAEAIVGDARKLPLSTGSFDAAISLAAIDHLRRADIPVALAEAARVLKPGGAFLLMVVNADAWARFASPHAVGHHPRADPNRWRAMLERAGFEILEQGTEPAVLFFLARRSTDNGSRTATPPQDPSSRSSF